jgi:hypothetical protein
MARPTALTGNAADPRLVKYAGRKAKEQQLLFDEALKAAMTQPAVRLVMWEILSRTGIYETINETNAQIYYLTGRRNFGLELLADLTRVDENLYLAMETEARARKRLLDRENAAVQTAPAVNNQGDDQ